MNGGEEKGRPGGGLKDSPCILRTMQHATQFPPRHPEFSQPASAFTPCSTSRRPPPSSSSIIRFSQLLRGDEEKEESTRLSYLIFSIEAIQSRLINDANPRLIHERSRSRYTRAIATLPRDALTAAVAPRLHTTDRDRAIALCTCGSHKYIDLISR